MRLIKLDDQGGIARYPYTLRMLQKDNPNVSIPKNPSDETLAALSAAQVTTAPRPEGDVVTEGEPEPQADGTWQQTWDVRAYTAEEAQAALDDAKSAAHRRINDGYDADSDALIAGYPEREVVTFDKQEREARAWTADNTAPTPFLDALMSTRVIDKAELVSRIIAKADAFADASGQLTGKRQTLRDEVEAIQLADYASTAEAIAAVEAIIW